MQKSEKKTQFSVFQADFWQSKWTEVSFVILCSQKSSNLMLATKIQKKESRKMDILRLIVENMGKTAHFVEQFQKKNLFRTIATDGKTNDANRFLGPELVFQKNWHSDKQENQKKNSNKQCKGAMPFITH